MRCSIRLSCSLAMACVAACASHGYRGQLPSQIAGPLAPYPEHPAPTLPIIEGADAAATIPLSLAEVVRLCVLADPQILAGLQSVAQARADHITAALEPNPTISVVQSFVPLGGSQGPPQLDAWIGYSLDALLFGKRRAAMTSTRIGVDVAIAEYADIARVRVLDAITAYFDVIEARELARIANDEVAQLERLVELTERRVTIGSAGKLEIERVRLAVLGGKRRLVEADAEVANARSRLRARLGLARGAERADAAGNLDAGSPPDAPDPAIVLASAQQHRPDLAALVRSVERARAELARERRNAWPTLDITLGYTAVGFPDASFWGAGLELSLPVSDRNQGNIAHAAAEVRRAELVLASAQIELRSELEQALADYRAAREIVTAIDAPALAAASSVRQKIEEAYGLGGRTLLEVLDAQAAYRELFRENVAARANLLRAWHRLNALAGTEIVK